MSWPLGHIQPATPGLLLRFRFVPGVAVERTATGVLVKHRWGMLAFEGAAAAVGGVLERLACTWTSLHELESAALGGGGGAVHEIAARVSQHMAALAQLSFVLAIRLDHDQRQLLSIAPISYDARPLTDAALPRDARLSALAFLQRHDEGLVLESAAAVHRIILHGDWGASLAGRLARGLREIPDEALRIAIGLIGATGMLEGQECRAAAGVSEDLLRIGEFHDLLFHRRSRFGRHDGAFGAEFPYIADEPAPPAITPARSDALIALETPNEAFVRERDLTLTQALERRASWRVYGSELTASLLAEFLFRSARMRGRYGPHPEAGMPYEAGDRPFPSGGGVHDIELYLIVTRVSGLSPGTYRYVADRHGLEPTPTDPGAIARVVTASMRASGAPEAPPVLIKMVSRFARMAWKYRAISYATTLKNVGVLYQTMYLVATAMGLAGCALGSGDDVATEQALGLAARSELAVGDFMLGVPRSSEQTSGQLRRHHDPTWLPLSGPDWGRG